MLYHLAHIVYVIVREYVWISLIQPDGNFYPICVVSQGAVGPIDKQVFIQERLRVLAPHRLGGAQPHTGVLD